MGSVLSVVVPIYNVAPYLDECLTSIAEQTHRDLEVVMVDDGSTDDSGAIAAAFAARDSRFRLVTQENRGLSAARNNGLGHITGDFLQFVDSDDVLPSYAMELLLSTVEQTGSDFATRSEEHTSELQSRNISYAVFCLKKNTSSQHILHPVK